MKKLNQKGFTHHLLIFGLLALVVGAAGFAGYRIWKNKNIDAQAENGTLLLSTGPVNETLSIKACRGGQVATGKYWVTYRVFNSSSTEYDLNIAGTSFSIPSTTSTINRTMHTTKNMSDRLTILVNGVKKGGSLLVSSIRPCWSVGILRTTSIC